jgi:hypothetical protein
MQDLIGEDFVYLGSEGMRGLDRGGPVHHWHTDGAWSLDKLNYKRIKIMLYLDSLKKESGALRVIPGFHKLPFHNELRPFQEANGMENPTFFGMDGADVPAYVVETEPGDMVIFNQWLFHAVYGKVGGRRNIVLRFADCSTDVDLTILGRSPEIFNPHEALESSDSLRIQHLIAGLTELGAKIESEIRRRRSVWIYLEEWRSLQEGRQVSVEPLLGCWRRLALLASLSPILMKKGLRKPSPSSSPVPKPRDYS